MSKITEIIFNGKEHYITSKFGSRAPIKTSAGTTSNVHTGTDYGTNNKKIAQYAIEDGTVLSCGTDGLGGKYAWVQYPRLNVKMLHYHLDRVSCKKGQAVSKGTLLGYTGMTGKATGVHLHLAIVDLANNTYVDPEKFDYKEPTVETVEKSIDELAQEVLNGKWGNGSDRRKRLEAAGYNYTAVQAKVNQLLYGKKPQTKSIDELAREVIRGDWGNGEERKRRLTAAGYDYKAVQKRINELL